MSPWKIAGIVAAGAGLAALVGGGVWWWRRNKGKPETGPVPSRVPREPDAPRNRENIPPDQRPSRAHLTKPRGHVVERDDLDAESAETLNGMFSAEGWPPDEETLNNLEQDDVIVFAVESEETGNYDHIQRELITARVLSVEKSRIRARIYGEVKHAEHLGSLAGHGYRIGDLMELPRSMVLVAAKRNDLNKSGYGSQGDPARTFEPSNHTKEVYTIRPGTAYDLVLPYRTEELVWKVDRELVEMTHIGEKRLIEQIMFSEGSLRGAVSVRALDRDPEAGTVLVARWDFVIESC